VADLVVVGAGFWGVATALVAEAAGAKVTLVASQEPTAASRAASGYFARSWFKDFWKDRADVSEELARRHGIGVTWTGADVATFANVKAGNPELVFKPDWAVFDPAAFLARRPVDVPEGVAKVAPGRVETTSGRVLDASAIVVAVGVGTEPLLARSNLPPLGVGAVGGRGLVLAGTPPKRTICAHVTPYHANTMRPWGAGLRIGETVEVKPDDAPLYISKMLKSLDRFIPHPVRIIEERWGQRPTLKGGPRVSMLAPGIVVATGGGRVGGLLSFWAATEACRMLRIVP
jgi:glycine/D-amino acid oxidase-like deaminating enzyme